MPELPEVENIAQGLRENILDREIVRFWVQTPIVLKGEGAKVAKSRRGFLHSLTGQRITVVTRRAKRLILGLEQGQALVIQLGMTGKFLLQDSQTERLKHTRLVLVLDSGPEVRFVDTRRFGRIWLFHELDPKHPDQTMSAAGMGPLGPDAPTITLSEFKACLQSQRAIKTLLLDQSRIAGLGNIYVDESLFAAGIHPLCPACYLKPDEVKRLHQQVKAVLRRAIRAGGTTFSDYRNAYGDMGRFRKRLKVYGRDGKPCKSCHAPIEKYVVGGRGTHVCPSCQPESKNKK